MRDAALLDSLAGADTATVERLAQATREDPNRVHRLVAALSSGRSEAETGAAEVLEALSRETPELLEGVTRRLFRVTSTSAVKPVRLALARIVPRLRLRRGETGRFAFVFEGWLDEPDGEIKRAGMDAMVALVPQRPEIADRVRHVIETRAAAGSPTAARHGRRLLEQLKTF